VPNNTESNEPVGIVISRGAAPAAAAPLLAFVWGPAPEVEAEVTPAVTKAA
jgi:hypothetical protein